MFLLTPIMFFCPFPSSDASQTLSSVLPSQSILFLAVVFEKQLDPHGLSVWRRKGDPLELRQALGRRRHQERSRSQGAPWRGDVSPGTHGGGHVEFAVA